MAKLSTSQNLLVKHLKMVGNMRVFLGTSMKMANGMTLN